MTALKRKRKLHPNSLRNLEPTKWKPGVSGNPGGRKKDIASELAASIFEQNKAKIYRAMARQLLKGETSAFVALADRGFGKVPQKVMQDVNLDVASSGRLEALLARAIAAGDKPDGSE